MDLCNKVLIQIAGWPLSVRASILCGKKFHVGHDAETCHPVLFLPAMLNRHR